MKQARQRQLDDQKGNTGIFGWKIRSYGKSWKEVGNSKDVGWKV